MSTSYQSLSSFSTTTAPYLHFSAHFGSCSHGVSQSGCSLAVTFHRLSVLSGVCQCGCSSAVTFHHLGVFAFLEIKPPASSSNVIYAHSIRTFSVWCTGDEVLRTDTDPHTVPGRVPCHLCAGPIPVRGACVVVYVVRLARRRVHLLLPPGR